MSKTKLRSAVLVIFGVLVVSGPLFADDNQVHVVPEAELKSWWQTDPLSPRTPPPYPVEALQAGVEGCMAVAFMIHGDGSVSNERVWLDKVPPFAARKAMEQSTLLSVHRWHFIPTSTNANHDPVYTYEIVTFDRVADPEKPSEYELHRSDKLRAECMVSDFPQQVQAMINAAAQAKGGNP